jgi:hypothetical protein
MLPSYMSSKMPSCATQELQIQAPWDWHEIHSQGMPWHETTQSLSGISSNASAD